MSGLEEEEKVAGESDYESLYFFFGRRLLLLLFPAPSVINKDYYVSFFFVQSATTFCFPQGRCRLCCLMKVLDDPVVECLNAPICDGNGSEITIYLFLL